MELIGIPHRLVVSDRGLENGTIEYKHRSDTDTQDIAVSEVISYMTGKVTVN